MNALERTDVRIIQSDTQARQKLTLNAVEQEDTSSKVYVRKAQPDVM